MRVKSRTRSAYTRAVLGSGSTDEIHVLVARLAVLYEDLRLEAYGVAEDKIPCLDQLDDRYRRLYFVRRAILTLIEFSEGLRKLNKCEAFGVVKAKFDVRVVEKWNTAVCFFEENHTFLKKVRNDIGGHFGQEAARYAVQNIHPQACSTVERVASRSGRASGSKLHFAGEIVATATLRHITANSTEQKSAKLIQTWKKGFECATAAMNPVIDHYLWPRFGH